MGAEPRELPESTDPFSEKYMFMGLNLQVTAAVLIAGYTLWWLFNQFYPVSFAWIYGAEYERLTRIYELTLERRSESDAPVSACVDKLALLEKLMDQ